MKTFLGRYGNDRGHWVGDGFPVRSLFSYGDLGQHASPFLLLDYAGPHNFEPTDQRRGVGQHPHRGFETVTIVYDGEVEHRDSVGNGGIIGPGDVQWMTAGGGILHEEFHSRAFAKAGGPFRMVQLWVNLPAKDKMTAPGYQGILSAETPTVTLNDGAGTARIIAGELDGARGPARTFTPMNVWDVRLAAGKSGEFRLPAGRTLALVVLQGTVMVNAEKIAREAQMVVLGRDGERFAIEANTDATVLLLSGEPIDEPVVGYGPFVMNTKTEIEQAVADFNNGRFGRIPR